MAVQTLERGCAGADTGEDWKVGGTELDSLAVFSEEEIRVILDDTSLQPSDYPILAEIKGMSEEELSSYNRLGASNRFDDSNYHKFRAHWVKRERCFLEERMKKERGEGLSWREIEGALRDELFNGAQTLRFNAFYAKKYPDQISGHSRAV